MIPRAARRTPPLSLGVARLYLSDSLEMMIEDNIPGMSPVGRLAVFVAGSCRTGQRLRC